MSWLELHHEDIQALNARALNAESIEAGVLVADLQTGLARALAEVERLRVGVEVERCIFDGLGLTGVVARLDALLGRSDRTAEARR